MHIVEYLKRKTIPPEAPVVPCSLGNLRELFYVDRTHTSTQSPLKPQMAAH